jgi:hypothetical protein
MLEGNTEHRVMASDAWRPGVVGPFALYTMSSEQPVRSLESLTRAEDQSEADRVCPAKWNKQGGQMAPGKSDRRIVPQQLVPSASDTEPGNAGGGKASKLSREQVVPLTVFSGEIRVFSRLDRITE